MSLATVWSRAQTGLDAPSVAVEVNLAPGLPGMTIVGLPEAAVRESKDRVRAAVQNSGFDWPARRITVNLAPADLPKEGGRFDLAIAVGIVVASGQLSGDGVAEALAAHEFFAELSLSGELRPVRGCLPAALAATRAGRTVVVAPDNGAEAALAPQATARIAAHFLDVCHALAGQTALEAATSPHDTTSAASLPDLRDVRGQHRAKRALEIAAAGEHSLLMQGPPGTGKSMLAARLPGILPPLSEAESLEVAAIQSVGRDGFDPAQWGRRPYRCPHHSASMAAIVGGGGQPKPGEVSRAHRGILFLDELPEFERRTLEALREPLEARKVTISRAAQQVDYPADFQLIAAMNPCPGGCADDLRNPCRCTPEQIARYQSRLSGPLLDRVDIRITVPRLPTDQLTAQQADGEPSGLVAERVAAARQVAMGRQGCPNARLDAGAVDEQCGLADDDRAFLSDASERLSLSARGYHRLLRVARTISDMVGADMVQRTHLAEAMTLRRS